MVKPTQTQPVLTRYPTHKTSIDLADLGWTPFQLQSCCTAGEPRSCKSWHHSPLGWHRTTSKHRRGYQRSLACKSQFPFHNYYILFLFQLPLLLYVFQLVLNAAHGMEAKTCRELDCDGSFACLQDVCFETSILIDNFKVYT